MPVSNITYYLKTSYKFLAPHHVHVFLFAVMKCALRPLHKAGTLSLARRLSVRHSVCPSSTVSIIVCLLLKYCRFSVAVTRWTQSAYTYSYSTLGPVSARVGEHASLDGKPSRRRTRHPGLLSLSPSSAVRLE